MRVALVAVAFPAAAAILLVPAVSAQTKLYDRGKVSTVKTKDVHYAIRVPKKLNRKRGSPSIVFIHGSNMRGENYAWSLQSAASLRDWILIGPTGPKKVNEKAYNHDPGDERYIAKIIKDVEKRLAVKMSRIYVGGHSQGGFLSHAVAQHLPDRIDGVIACSSGSWVGPKKVMKKGKGRSRQQIPVAIVHAQNDPVVGFRASVGVYDAYVKAGHDDVRLFAPTQGAHMFMRLPILPAIKWLELMNETDKGNVSKTLAKTKMDKDPRTLWDAARRLKALSKGGKSKKADALVKKMTAEGHKLAKELDKRLKKAKKADPQLAQESWSFLADWGMVAAEARWRKTLKRALK